VKTLIVPLDGAPENEGAATIGAALARELGAEVVLVAVSPFEDQTHRDLERVAWAGGFDARTEVVDSEDVVAALGAFAEHHSEPVICMTTRGRGRLGQRLLGSVAEQLLREVPVPYVLVGPRCRTRWPGGHRRMVVAVDGSSASNAILPLAADFARRLALEPWLTQVLHPLDAESARAPHELLDVVAARFGKEVPDVRVCATWNRDVSGELLHVAEVLSASVLALGTHGRTGAARLAMGSVAMEVVHRATCPVLTVRSPDL
jgi:nucleotide-binding universal stress UspA family protein